MSAVHAAIAIVVYRAVADVILVHQVYDVHDGLRVVGRISINFDVEDVSSSCEVVVRSLYLGLVLRRALVVYGHVIRVGVVYLIGNAGNLAKGLAVDTVNLPERPSAGVASTLQWCW